MITDFNKLGYKKLPCVNIMLFSTGDLEGISEYFWASEIYEL